MKVVQVTTLKPAFNLTSTSEDTPKIKVLTTVRLFWIQTLANWEVL
jgi:hypothetical protein